MFMRPLASPFWWQGNLWLNFFGLVVVQVWQFSVKFWSHLMSNESIVTIVVFRNTDVDDLSGHVVFFIEWLAYKFIKRHPLKKQNNASTISWEKTKRGRQNWSVCKIKAFNYLRSLNLLLIYCDFKGQRLKHADKEQVWLLECHEVGMSIRLHQRKTKISKL